MQPVSQQKLGLRIFFQINGIVFQRLDGAQQPTQLIGSHRHLCPFDTLFEGVRDLAVDVCDKFFQADDFVENHCPFIALLCGHRFGIRNQQIQLFEQIELDIQPAHGLILVDQLQNGIDIVGLQTDRLLQRRHRLQIPDLIGCTRGTSLLEDQRFQLAQDRITSPKNVITGGGVGFVTQSFVRMPDGEQRTRKRLGLWHSFSRCREFEKVLCGLNSTRNDGPT